MFEIIVKNVNLIPRFRKYKKYTYRVDASTRQRISMSSKLVLTRLFCEIEKTNWNINLLQYHMVKVLTFNVLAFYFKNLCSWFFFFRNVLPFGSYTKFRTIV